MNNTERPIQYGLGGDFGGPQAGREIEKVAQEKTQIKEDKEKIERRRVVPKGTSIYVAGQSDFAYTTTDSFYVLLSENDKKSSVKVVAFEPPEIIVYRDGKRYIWVSDPDLSRDDDQKKYVPKISVHSRRLIEPKKSK